MATIRALLISVVISAVIWVVGSMIFVNTFLAPRNTAEADPAMVADLRALRDAEVSDGVRSAARYLTRASLRDGQFRYRINLNPQVEVAPSYNMLRHAGAVYALASYQQLHPSQRALDALNRSAEFLRREAMGPVPGNESLLAVWSAAPEDGPEGGRFAKLGGAGLGLGFNRRATEVRVDYVQHALSALLAFEQRQWDTPPGETPES